jgi:hypothetical protein
MRSTGTGYKKGALHTFYEASGLLGSDVTMMVSDVSKRLRREFRENGLGDSDTLFRSVNFYAHFSNVLTKFGEIRFRGLSDNSTE